MKQHLQRMGRQAVYSLPLCLFLAGTLTVFAATQLLHENPAEFWFTWQQMIPGVAAAGGCLLGALLAVMALLPRRAFPWGQAVLMAVGVAALLQGNGLNADYGVLDGKAIDWNALIVYGVTNTLLWAGMIFIAGALRRWKGFRVLCIALPLTLTLGEAALTWHWAQAEEAPRAEAYLSGEGLYTVGAEENVVLLVLDSVDAEMFGQALQEDPELAAQWDGFTWYRNVLGISDPTKYGLPGLLTGQAHTAPVDYMGFIAGAYDQTPLYTALRGDAWDARFYTDSRYLTLEDEVVDNLARETLHVRDARGMTRDLLRMCMFRYAPHFLKPPFWMYGKVFQQYAESTGAPVYAVTDAAFDRAVTEQGLTLQPGRAFRMIHLAGMHPPYTLDASCRVQPEGVTPQEQMKGCMKLAGDYLQELRRLSLYDDAAILVLADHGTRQLHRPMLLLKRPGETGALRISDAPVSYADLPATYTALLTGEEGENVLWRVPDAPRTRRYYHESSRNSSFSLYEYATDQTAPAWEDLIPTGQVFHGETQQPAAPYQLGTTLYFDLRATARPYLVSGFSSADFHSTWTSGPEGLMVLPLAAAPSGESLTLEMKFLSIMTGCQRMRVEVGGETVLDGEVTQPELRCTIPASLVRDQVLELRFFWPDAVSHQALGLSEDTREVAFALTEMTILNSTKEERP